MLKDWLQHPLTRGRDLDLAATTNLRRQVLAGKPFLKAIYREWYERLAGSLPAGGGTVLEIGSGAGFLRERIPELVTSDVLPLDGVDRVLDAGQLPFADGELKAVLMIDVLHHLPEPSRFFHEASRTVRAGGIISMIEPWNTPWSRFIYQHLHHEPFDPRAGWTLERGGPLSRANGALPWILFERDRRRFAAEHPTWRVSQKTLLMPVAYLLSGGVSLRNLAPGSMYAPVRRLERWLERAGDKVAMFAHLVLERTIATA
jgi:SAM-dependent methyltransferase